MTSQRDPRFDFSGGIQNATTWQLRKPNEVEDAINGRFNDVIGAVVRRYGYVKEGAVLQTGKRGLGLHESKFTAGARFLSAINDSGDTVTKIKIYTNGADTWADMSLPGSIDPNTRINFIDSLNETYVAGKSTSTGARMSLLNIKDASTVSATRNLIGAPKARFIAEYGGSLYAINVDISGTVYSDRAYKSSPALGIVTFTQGDQDSFGTIQVDSVRYLKAGMAIDIYSAGTETKTNDVSITTVDKATNIINCSNTSSSTFATTDVSTATDVITTGVNIATGTPVKVTSSTTVPAGLTSGTIYYVINASSTTIKLATTRANATAGTAIDITSTGSGTHTLTRGVHIPDNDEVWLDGRKGELCYLWNTDYPTVEDADYLRIPPGVDSDSEITGYAKTNNRLEFFTKNSTHKWDGAQLITIYEDIGCINHETIQNISGWLIWVDAEGEVRARNDASGQDELISRTIRNLLTSVPGANLLDAAAGRINSVYKLCLGTVNGKVLRLCYDFDTNTWEHDEYSLNMVSHARSDMSGDMRLYFLGDNGQMYLDEEGNTDDGVTIPFSVTFGRTNQTTEQRKNYHGVFVYGRNVTGATVKVSLDGKTDFPAVGTLTQEVTKIPLSTASKQLEGRDVNLKVSINNEGTPPSIEGVVYYWNQTEDKFGQPT